MVKTLIFFNVLKPYFFFLKHLPINFDKYLTFCMAISLNNLIYSRFNTFANLKSLYKGCLRYQGLFQDYLIAYVITII